MRLREVQAAFRRWTLDGEAGPLTALAGPDHAEARLAVHRGNVLGSLAGALADTFPVVERLVGPPFFRAAATAFARAEPPERPELLRWGGGFPGFLRGFPPAADLPYLGDVAALEWARTESLFAADAAPLDPAALAGLPADHAAGLVLVPLPSLRLTASRWPVLSLWEAHQSPDTAALAALDLSAGGERVLVVRPGAAPRMRRLTAGDHALLTACRAGRPLGDAAVLAAAADPGFDLVVALGNFLAAGLFAGFHLAASQGDGP